MCSVHNALGSALIFFNPISRGGWVARYRYLNYQDSRWVSRDFQGRWWKWAEVTEVQIIELRAGWRKSEISDSSGGGGKGGEVRIMA